MKYEVTIDLYSVYKVVEADSKEEALEKAEEAFSELCEKSPELDGEIYCIRGGGKWYELMGDKDFKRVGDGIPDKEGAVF